MCAAAFFKAKTEKPTPKPTVDKPENWTEDIALYPGGKRDSFSLKHSEIELRCRVDKESNVVLDAKWYTPLPCDHSETIENVCNQAIGQTAEQVDQLIQDLTAAFS